MTSRTVRRTTPTYRRDTRTPDNLYITIRNAAGTRLGYLHVTPQGIGEFVEDVETTDPVTTVPSSLLRRFDRMRRRGCWVQYDPEPPPLGYKYESVNTYNVSRVAEELNEHLGYACQVGETSGTDPSRTR